MRGGEFSSAAQDTVEERAKEIAAIDHPEIEGITETDRQKALDELRGQPHGVTTDDDEMDEVATLDPSEAATDTGHRTKPIQPRSEQENAEDLTGEGLDEALHEQMLAAERPDEEEDKQESP
ncbi:MAG TPA: hypothetical protein DCZ95_19245 [Verrucomicrobia bacterium]|nr:MAG: hypothetical protein A2X46_13415 [Lentisphaerae bacterium GWF2_57_35]HBA86223.1 hypothetical protein [Verrucomicrobiota bacterium]